MNELLVCGLSILRAEAELGRESLLWAENWTPMRGLVDAHVCVYMCKRVCGAWPRKYTGFPSRLQPELNGF